jgi:hypothetical protein
VRKLRDLHQREKNQHPKEIGFAHAVNIPDLPRPVAI